jgi:hypothetical protein
MLGRAMAQAVSRRLPNELARVRAQVRACGIYDGQSRTGAGFLRVLQFHMPILIPPTAPHSLSSSTIIRGWHNRPIVDVVPVDSVSPHPRKLKTKRKFNVFGLQILWYT